MVVDLSYQNLFRIRPQLTCPHCWTVFPTDQLLRIAECPDLLGDSRLGESARQRFLPSRFDPKGTALDGRGFPCRRLACPNCHLTVPRSLLESSPFFVSIVGAPASGKSYFLASMTWALRKSLPKRFCLGFNDADPEMNLRLQRYESMQFLQREDDRLVALEKTETHGDLYNTILFNGQEVSYPQPFVFSLTPMPDHPNAVDPLRYSATLCLYDNAGESFLPGEDRATQPVTRHLAKSHAVFFLFDPTQDDRFRSICKNETNDPQLAPRSDAVKIRRSLVRQETILMEMIERIRGYVGLGTHDVFRTPLTIIVTKFDAWKHLLNVAGPREPWQTLPNQPGEAIDSEVVRNMSKRVRELLLKTVPDIVSLSERFANTVTYLPVSATGRPPSVDSATGALGFRTAEIAPIWIDVPIIDSLSRSFPGTVPVLRRGGPPPLPNGTPPPENGQLLVK